MKSRNCVSSMLSLLILTREVHSLKLQLAKVKELVQAAKNENQRLAVGVQEKQEEAVLHHLRSQWQEQEVKHKQLVEKLSGIILEKDKKIAELSTIEYSFRKSNEQKLDREASLEKQETAYREVKEENERLHKDLGESSQRARQLERVIQHLRERQEGAKLRLNSCKKNSRRSMRKCAPNLKSSKWLKSR